ncbi:unnamed protein product [Discula destructiva]
MQKNIFFLLAGYLASCVAGRSCATSEPTEEEIALAKSFYAMEQEARVAGTFAAAAQTITVNVYFHVISISNSEADGYITASTIADQVDAMNTAFAPQGVSFVQAGLDYTTNSAYADASQELAMKRALRKGTYADLNIYFLPRYSYLGQCYFPASTSGSDTTTIRDGCMVSSFTVPGGSEARYNQGLTAVHEVGHWFGLYHTFQGGCSVGDRVDDTPAEESFAEGCPVGRDTCPSLAGADPIHNYMDYTDDACYEEFTVGQTDRMYTQWNTYRAQFQ